MKKFRVAPVLNPALGGPQFVDCVFRVLKKSRSSSSRDGRGGDGGGRWVVGGAPVDDGVPVDSARRVGRQFASEHVRGRSQFPPGSSLVAFPRFASAVGPA